MCDPGVASGLSSPRSLALAALLLLTTTTTTVGAQDAVTAAKVDEIFAAIDRTSSPGCALGVYREGRLIYSRGYGMADLENRIPYSPRTVTYIGSVSKQFTAASIALAADMGLLSLDDDIRKYVPEMPAYGKPITIRHLIHHTTGIRDYYELMDLAGLPVANVIPDEEALRLIAQQKSLNFEPGERHLYSNSGYFLMSVIVRRATGKSLRQFADEHIFQPLGMRDTHFHDDFTHVIANRATSYEPHRDGGYRVSFLGNFNKVGPGGLWTTVEDLARWDRNFYEDKLGEPGFIPRLHTRGVLNNGDTLSYAFALVHGEYKGVRTVGHSGGFMGFRAHLVRFPEQRLAVACLCNAGAINPSRLAHRVADVFLSDAFRVALAEYEGAYSNEDVAATYRIAYRDGNLWMQRKNTPEEILEPADQKDRFTFGAWTVAFHRDGPGVLQGFEVSGGRARGFHFRRLP